nr:1,6-anhydro-N-acetylmuramyl-L-alanine amidase AmpD [Marinobacter halophilus]
MKQTGRYPGCRWSPSPNFGSRPQNSKISLLVVHNISLPPGQFGGPEIEQFFCNQLDPAGHPYFETIASVQVSAHALVRRDGSVIQFVSCLERAWHAGRSCFGAEEECNDFSIGIELEGTDDIPYTPEQYQTLASMVRLTMMAWPDVTPDRVAGHCDIAPGRKTDPGPAFDWPYFSALLADQEIA